MLTEKQKKFFEKLKETYGKEILPSFDKIAKKFGFRHKNSVWQYFKKLKEENLIIEKDKRFHINRELFGAIQFVSRVRAGFASVGEDGTEKRVSFDEQFDIDNPSTFLFKVRGDSMVDAGIFEDDTVIIKKTNHAKNGDIVLAFIDGGYTLKYYKNNGNDVWLQPANKNYPIIKPKEILEIFGVVKGVVRKI